MQYGNKAFSKNGKKTMEVISDPSIRLGNRGTFSTLDLQQLNALYDCSSEYMNTTEQCALQLTTIMALRQLVNLGTGCTVTSCGIALWSHQSAETASSERSIYICI